MKSKISRQEIFKDFSRGEIKYRSGSKTPLESSFLKSASKQRKSTNTPSQMTKYQSYLRFVQEQKIPAKKKIMISKQENRQIFMKQSKTPDLQKLFAPYLDRGRRSLLQRRKSPPKNETKIETTNFHQKHRKLSSGNKNIKIKKSKSKYHSKKVIDIDIEQQKMQKVLFDGIQFFRDLGKGAHALVRSAVDWKNNRKIAVKVYNKSELDLDEKLNIEREIEILKSINHKNVTSLYDVFETPKTINLIMQYGGGNSLHQHIRSRVNGIFTEKQAKPLFKQIFGVVSYLHQLSIVHRDIKPQNILLNRTQQIKLIDFGFSIRSKLDQKVDTFCGTPTYMAPQIVTKKRHVGIFADRWSLGVLLYTVLQGIYPFKAVSQKDLFVKIVKGQFQFITPLSKQATNLINSFLKINPQQRISASQALKSKWFRNSDSEFN